MAEQALDLDRQVQDVLADYPGLTATRDQHGMRLIGELAFIATYNGVSLEDRFQVEVFVPSTYPDDLPWAKETGGRIPADFHKNDGGELCLEVPSEILKKFAANPTLLGFIENLVIDYLYSFCQWEKTGQMPYGERPHGDHGIMDYYLELLGVESEIVATRFVRILALSKYRGHHLCLCGSGTIMRQCHGPILLSHMRALTQTRLVSDYLFCLNYLMKKGVKLPQIVPTEKEWDMEWKIIEACGKRAARNSQALP